MINGTATVPHVGEIKRLFPNAQISHFISYGYGKPAIWNTEVDFGGRYELTYRVKVFLDYRQRRITEVVGDPNFDLTEISRIYDTGTGSGVGADIGSDRRIDEQSWEKVVSAGGDFSVIGISIKSNNPVSGFDDFVNPKRRSGMVEYDEPR